MATHKISTVVSVAVNERRTVRDRIGWMIRILACYIDGRHSLGLRITSTTYLNPFQVDSALHIGIKAMQQALLHEAHADAMEPFVNEAMDNLAAEKNAGPSHT